MDTYAGINASRPDRANPTYLLVLRPARLAASPILPWALLAEQLPYTLYLPPDDEDLVVQPITAVMGNSDYDGSRFRADSSPYGAVGR